MGGKIQRHQESVRVLKHCDPPDDSKESLVDAFQWMGVAPPPPGGSDEVGWDGGGGGIYHRWTECGLAIHCDTDNSGYM